MVRETGCEGWRVADLLVHLRFGTEEMLHGLASPRRRGPADRDYVSYWKDWPPSVRVTFSDVRFTWATAAAYASAEALRRHFDAVVAIAEVASRAALEGQVRFWGHVMATRDFAARGRWPRRQRGWLGAQGKCLESPGVLTLRTRSGFFWGHGQHAPKAGSGH